MHSEKSDAIYDTLLKSNQIKTKRKTAIHFSAHACDGWRQTSRFLTFKANEYLAVPRPIFFFDFCQKLSEFYTILFFWTALSTLKRIKKRKDNL